jgi:RNA polymerase sigma factor (TIGR02999 family)
MTPGESKDITRLLAAWGDGDREALDGVVASLYPELRRIARRQLAARAPGGTLESAALANEAYLKLMRAGGIECANRVHFLSLCAQIVRRLLVDHARKRGYAKRGGGAVRVTLDDRLAKANPSDEIDMIALDDALDALAKVDVRKSKLVELRYFGGLSVEEAAEALSISPETAKRDWRMAKAWLFSALAGSQAPGSG